VQMPLTAFSFHPLQVGLQYSAKGNGKDGALDNGGGAERGKGRASLCSLYLDVGGIFLRAIRGRIMGSTVLSLRSKTEEMNETIGKGTSSIQRGSVLFIVSGLSPILPARYLLGKAIRVPKSIRLRADVNSRVRKFAPRRYVAIYIAM